MQENYFVKFPKIAYDGKVALDLSRRAVIDDDISRVPNVFYPVTIKAGLRTDSLADAYYEDPALDWLVYLANETVDPYYHWYMSEKEFADFIVKKYGSTEYAIKKTKYYRNNWAADSTSISPGYYQSSLPPDWRRYYEPEYGRNAKVLGYVRKKADWVVNTNRILEFSISSYAAGNAFSDGEFVDIRVSAEDVGAGEVIRSNSSVVVIQHVSGNTSANGTHTKTIVGETSGTSVVANAVATQAEMFNNAHARFWTSISYFDYEVEQNEQRKNIHVIAKSFALTTAEKLRLKLAEQD